MYEIAEWCDYGLWVIKTVKTEKEAMAEVERLNKPKSTFMSYGYRKIDK